MKFEINGLNHVAFVCEDMQRTVDFYTNRGRAPLPGDCGTRAAGTADRGYDLTGV
jgi:catechol 2,3-dioxygenase-like lactoylglutathione lyase family enzyme